MLIPKRKVGRAMGPPANDRKADAISTNVNDPDEMSATAQQLPSGASKLRTVASGKGKYCKDAINLSLDLFSKRRTGFCMLTIETNDRYFARNSSENQRRPQRPVSLLGVVWKGRHKKTLLPQRVTDIRTARICGG
jgi:hypothetical protein